MIFRDPRRTSSHHFFHEMQVAELMPGELHDVRLGLDDLVEVEVVEETGADD